MPVRKPSSRSVAAVASLLISLNPHAGWAADSTAPTGGFWDRVLETLDMKATPSAQPPAFVRRTRPDPAELGFLKASVPHAVSTLKVKTVAEIAQKKALLDAARVRQTNPAAPAPLGIGKVRPAPTEDATSAAAAARTGTSPDAAADPAGDE